jgi:NADPH-dependent 2,4-dienoyl-CoA reductase/sulfur reductase-like enzyme
VSHLKRHLRLSGVRLMVQQVIIIGGGFGGLSAARALRGAAVRVTLVDKRNYHLFRPMLSASIAHEINQPLGAVVANGYASLRWLLAESPNIAMAHEAAERIVRDGKAAREVVKKIRALLKRAEVQHVILDLNSLIGEVKVPETSNWGLTRVCSSLNYFTIPHINYGPALSEKVTTV